MKIIRKIAAFGTGAAMLGATMTGALAADLADLPAPFVADSAYVDVAMVIGNELDGDARTEIRTYMDSLATATTTTGGETYTLGTTSSYVELDEGFNTTKATLTDTQFEVALEDGTFTEEDDDTDYDYDQKLTLHDETVSFKALNKLDYYNDASAKDPLRVIDFDSDTDYAWTYTLEFDDSAGVNLSTFDDSEVIDMMGKEFTIKTATDTTDVYLYTSNEEETLALGESVSLGGHTVEFSGINSAGTSAEFIVDGEATNAAGEADSIVVDTIDSDVENMYIKDITTVGVGGTDTVSYTVTLAYGDGKITLQQADSQTYDEIKIGDETISGFESNLTGTNNSDVTQINFRFSPHAYFGDELDDDNSWNLEEGESIVDPVFGVTFSFDGASMDLDDEEKTYFALDRNDDYVEMTFTNIDEETFQFKVWDRDNTSANVSWYNNTDGDTFHWNASNTNVSEDEVFIVNEGSTNDSVARVYKLEKVASDGKVDIKLMYESGSVYEAEDADEGDSFGNDDSVTLSVVDSTLDVVTLTFASGAHLVGSYYENNSNGNFSILGEGIITINGTHDYTGNVTLAEVWFEESAELKGNQNNEMWYIDVAEEATDTSDYMIDLNYSHASNPTFVDDDAGDYTYYLSDLGTYLEIEKENEGETFKMYYSQDATEYDITIGIAATVDSTSAALMTADEVTDPTAYNLILVGGPAVNSLTAQFEGVSFPAYGADSEYSKNTGYLKMFDNGEKVALVVAGWEVDDTKRAAKVLANPDAFTLAGTIATVTGDSLEVSGITVA